MKRIALAGILATVALAPPAAAIDFSRTQAGPTSALVNTRLALTDSGALIAPSGSGLARSTNGGRKWTLLRSDTAKLTQQVAVGGGRLYGISSTGLVSSIDDGTSWTPFSAGLPEGKTLQTLFTDAQYVYVVVFTGTPDFHNHLYRSPHAAADFVDKTPPTVHHIRSATVAGGNLCAAMASNGVQYSSNQGDNWSLSTGPSGDWRMLAGAASGNAYLLKDGAAMMSSSNGCQNFTARASTGLPAGCSLITTAAGVDGAGALYRAVSTSADCLSLAKGRGVWRSVDDGANFVEDNGGDLVPFSTKNVSIHSLTNIDGTMFVGSGGSGVYAREDGTWARRDKGIKAAFVNSLAALGVPGRLAASAGGGGVFVTEDGGAHWRARNNGIFERVVGSLMSTGNALLVLAGGGADGKVYRTINDGGKWSESSTGIVAADLDGAGRLAKGKGGIYLATKLKVYRSTDSGKNWTDATGNLPAQSHGISANANGVFTYFGGSGVNSGIWRSTNSGGNWEQVNTGLTGPFFGAVFAATDVLLASTSSGALYRSTDNGDQWVPVTGYAKSAFGIQIMSMVEDDKGYLYIGDEHAGLSVSLDEGATWTPSSDGLFPSGSCIQRIMALAFDGEKIYAGEGGAGVFVSDPAVPGGLKDRVACTSSGG